MAQLVTDPDILEKLNGAPKKVTDPSILAKLNGEEIQKPESALLDSAKTIASMPERFGANVAMALPNIINQAVAGPQYLGRGVAENVDKAIGIDSQPRGDVWQPFYGSEDVLQELPKPLRPHTPTTVAGQATDVLGNVLAQIAGGKSNKEQGATIKNIASKIGESGILKDETSGGNLGETIKSGAKNIGEEVGTMKTGFNARSSEALEQAIKTKEADASNHFASMNGIGIPPEIAVKVFEHIDKSVRENREIDPDLHKDYVSVIERMKEKAQAGMTLGQIHNQRKLLRDVETKNYLNNKPVADVARQAIDAMDEALETAKQKGGSKEGSEGVQGMQNGIAKWAEARKFETVANIINKSQGDPNKLKNAFKALLNNKKQMRGFTTEERALIKAASENTGAESLMSTAGKMGIGINKGVSGNTIPWLPFVTTFYSHAATPYMAALTAGGTGAKYGQKLMARGKAENVLKAIDSRNKVRPIVPSMGMPMDDFISLQSQ